MKNFIGTAVQTSISLFFENLAFYKSGSSLFFTFDGYFEAWEQQNLTRHEEILLGSYSETFWPDGKLIGAQRRSKLDKK